MRSQDKDKKKEDVKEGCEEVTWDKKNLLELGRMRWDEKGCETMCRGERECEGDELCNNMKLQKKKGDII